MTTIEVRATALKVGDWVQINSHETSRISSIKVAPQTVQVFLTCGRRYVLDRYQGYMDKVISF